MRKSNDIEDRVVMCLTPRPNFVEEIFTAFRKLYPGIETEYIHEAGGASFIDFLSQVENGKNRADIMLLNDQQTEVLKIRGFIDKYDSPEGATFPGRAKDPDGYATQVFINPFSVAYNRSKVRPEEAPARYEDLLSAKWKGKLLYPDPRVSGSGFGWFAGPFAVLFRNAKHPLLGKRLIDFLLSSEGQKIIRGYHIPNRPDVPIGDRILERVRERLAGVKPVPFDSSLGKYYHENQEEAFRLLLPSPD